MTVRRFAPLIELAVAEVDPVAVAGADQKAEADIAPS